MTGPGRASAARSSAPDLRESGAATPPAIAADAELARIHSALGFLLQVTPVNSLEAWETFRASGFERPPSFRYRPPRPEVDGWERALAAVPLAEVDDPTLLRLLEEKAEELSLRIAMLRARGGPEFLEGGLRLYGTVDEGLLGLARGILSRLPPYDEPLGARGESEATEDELAEAARSELRVYRRIWPSFPAEAEVRDDVPPGLVVSQGRLLIGQGTTAPRRRVEALLHHEIGTHMVTYYNGAAQPLKTLRIGLGGYEILQEGLAVVSEYLVGGLTVGRLRVLAARVLAARSVVDGGDLVDTFRLLHRQHAFEPYSAYSIAMRVHRAGGFVKDLIYLRGLTDVARYVREEGELEPLFAGKFALHHLQDLRELRRRGLLRRPPVRPRILEHPRVGPKLERVRRGEALTRIFEGAAP